MEWLIVLTFFAGLASSILSGMGGGGGGFIMMPYLIFIGLSPAQALATVKLGSTGTTVGSLTAFKGTGLIRRDLAIPFMAITLVCALVAAWAIPQIDSAIFQKIIGGALIVLIPTLFIKKATFQPGERSRTFIIFGYIAYTIFAFLQAVIGTGMGAVLVLILMFLFGLNALEAQATKRIAQPIQGVILFVFLAFQGLVVWTHGIAGLLGAVIGSHIGTKFAIKRGTGFVKIMLAVVMATSGVVLLFF
jgi:uncharacterized membrane protein YfcA